MTTSVHVERLSADDLILMRRLNALFSEAFEDPEHYAANPPGDEWLAGLLAKEHVHALVAMRGDEMLGGLAAYELDKFEQARREIYIYDLAVAEAHRRTGVATSLINHLQDLAASRGAWVFFVQADYGDDPAIALYESGDPRGRPALRHRSAVILSSMRGMSGATWWRGS